MKTEIGQTLSLKLLKEKKTSYIQKKLIVKAILNGLHMQIIIWMKYDWIISPKVIIYLCINHKLEQDKN